MSSSPACASSSSPVNAASPGIAPICSLEMLETELVRVLYARDDPDRLLKAKSVIERYSGVDWISHQKCPDLDGFQLSGYQRVCVTKHTDLFHLLILSWAPGTQSPIHDHPCERCFLMAICGTMFEERYTLNSAGILELSHSLPIPVGVATWISDDLGLHSVGNNGTGLACSLHCYIPGFTTPCTIFDRATGRATSVSAIPKAPCAVPLSDVVQNKVSEYMRGYDDPSTAPVVALRRRADIEESFASSRCGIEFMDDSPPLDDQAVRRAIDTTCDLAVHTGHLYFFNQLLSKADPLAASADSLAAALNVNMYNFENAPVLQLMERRLLEHLASFFGWHKHGSRTTRNRGESSLTHSPTFDGMFLSGASLCNLTAMHAARTHLFPSLLEDGIGSKHLVVFTSEESHCSIEKACLLLGLGRRACLYIPCNASTGQVDVICMEQSIKDAITKGQTPFFINCTSGSTHSGTFDDCDALADLAARYNCWLHVDGALGASFVLPKEEPFTTLVRGMSRADSVSWNLHKLLGITLPCSVLLVRYPNALTASHTADLADPLGENAQLSPWLNTGSKSIMSSRRADAFKAWVLWKKLGDTGMANKVRLVYMHNMDLARMIRTYPRRVPVDNPTLPIECDEPVDMNAGAYQLAFEPTSACTCFYWLPVSLRKRFQSEGPVKLERELGIIASRMKTCMLREGCIMMSHFSTKHRPHFWRIPNIHQCMSQSQMWTILKLVNRVGNECFPADAPIDWEHEHANGRCVSTGAAADWQASPEIVRQKELASELNGLLDITNLGSIIS